jgi:hypothetical protein
MVQAHLDPADEAVHGQLKLNVAGVSPSPVTVRCPAAVADFRLVPVRPRDGVLVGLDFLS